MAKRNGDKQRQRQRDVHEAKTRSMASKRMAVKSYTSGLWRCTRSIKCK